MKLKEVQITTIATEDKEKLLRYYKLLDSNEQYAIINSLNYLKIKVEGINK